MKVYEKGKVKEGDVIKRWCIEYPDNFILLVVVKQNSRSKGEILPNERYTVKILKKCYGRNDISNANSDQEIGDVWNAFVLNGHSGWNDTKLSIKEATLEVL